MQVKRVAWFSALVPLLFPFSSLFSQQIGVGTPFNSIRNGYYERYGIAWELNWRGGNASFGLLNQHTPPYGGYGSSCGIQTGWRFGNRNYNGNIFLSAAQGYSASYTSQTPYVTMLNGYSGGFYDLSLSPFVTGISPVVGGCRNYGQIMPYVVPQDNSEQSLSLDRVQVMRRLLASQNQDNSSSMDELDPGEAMLPRHSTSAATAKLPLPAAQRSSADRPAPSVAEAKRLHEIENSSAEEEVSALFARAKEAEDAGKSRLAKIYYQMIVRRAQGELKQKAEQRLKVL